MSTRGQSTIQNGKSDERQLHPDRSTPFALASFRNWIRVLRKFGGVDAQFIKRAAFITLVSAATSPLRWYERLRYREVIKNTPITQPPLFILGHWRSGTTRLHYLITQDDQWGYIDSYQAMVPEFSLVGRNVIRPAIAKTIPPTRIADAMRMSAKSPQEEENAIADMSPYSFYHYWLFPQHAPEHLRRALLDGVAAPEVTKWQETYRTFLRRVTFIMEGKPLVIKNPAHTGRVKILLDMFPNAKFVYISRNPYTVFLSTRNLHQTLLRYFRLQELSQEKLEANILLFYKGFVQRYLAERDLIPRGNLTEVRFEDLETAPFAEVQRIYDELNLPGFAAAEKSLRAYIESTARYRKNEYTLSDDVRQKVNQNWRFAFDEWGYELRE